MTEFPKVLLEMPWNEQADYLRHQSQKELEVLWFLLQEHEQVLDRFKIAVFSILRDLYEVQEKPFPMART
jgi:hypothetical protein